MAAIELDVEVGEWHVFGEWRPEDDRPVLILRRDDLDRLTVGDLVRGLADAFDQWRGHNIKAYVSRSGLEQPGIQDPLGEVSFVWGELEPHRNRVGRWPAARVAATAALGLVVEPPRERMPAAGPGTSADDAYWTSLVASVRPLVHARDCRVIVSAQRRFDRSPGALELVVIPRTGGEWLQARRYEPLGALEAFGAEIRAVCESVGRGLPGVGPDSLR